MEDLKLKVWLNTDEAAEYLSTTKKGILNRVHRGELPFYKLGNLNRFKRVELDQHLESRRATLKRAEGN